MLSGVEMKVCSTNMISTLKFKPVFGVSDKARLKPVSSATETSLKFCL